MPFFSTSANTNTLNMEFECFSAGISSGKLEGLDPVEVSSRNTATSLGMNWYKFFYIPKYMQLDLHLFFFSLKQIYGLIQFLPIDFLGYQLRSELREKQLVTDL